MTDDQFDINALALNYGRMVDVPLLKDETPNEYRARLSGLLKEQGNIIEAHEVHCGRRFDDPSARGGYDPMVGIAGVCAMALQDKKYSTDSYLQVGDEIAAGGLVLGRDPNAGIEQILGIFGPGAGIEVLKALRKSN